MKKLVIYNNTKTYFYPTMEEANPERVARDFPIVNVPELKLVITTDVSGTIFYTAPVPLGAKADELGVNPDNYTTEEELLQAMEDVLNAPQPEPEASAEERIASALEFQSMMMM